MAKVLINSLTRLGMNVIESNTQNPIIGETYEAIINSDTLCTLNAPRVLSYTLHSDDYTVVNEELPDDPESD